MDLHENRRAVLTDNTHQQLLSLGLLYQRPCHLRLPENVVITGMPESHLISGWVHPETSLVKPCQASSRGGQGGKDVLRSRVVVQGVEGQGGGEGEDETLFPWD